MSDRHSKKPYSLRIDDELRQKVEDAAKGNGRSVNSEMTARLHASFDGEDGRRQKIITTDQFMQELVDAIVHAIQKNNN